jgi:hypothetical protein
MLITTAYAYSPWSQKPVSMIEYTPNNDVIDITYQFSPYAFVGAIANSFWLIFCVWFRPIAKHMFPSWAMEDPPIDINTVCKGCCLIKGETFGCFMSPKRCGKYVYKNGKWKETLL